MAIKKFIWLSCYNFLSYLKTIINELMIYFLIRLNRNYERVEVKKHKWTKRKEVKSGS